MHAIIFYLAHVFIHVDKLLQLLADIIWYKYFIVSLLA